MRDSASWSVLVSGHNDDWCEYAGDLTSYLAGLVRETSSRTACRPTFQVRHLPSRQTDVQHRARYTWRARGPIFEL